MQTEEKSFASASAACPDASFVVPCFNEAAAIPIFYAEMLKAVEPMGISFEIIFVDDGSRDASLEEMRTLAGTDARVRYVSFSRNFGKEAALLAGLEASRGNVVATLDVDLQDPPSLFPRLWAAVVNEGFDCAATRRADRKGEPPIRSFFSKKFYDVMAKISDAQIMSGARDYRVMRREMVEAILSLRERNRFTKGIYSWVGFKTKWFSFENVERSAGETKWSFRKLLLYSFDGIIAFSTVPLQIASVAGMLFAAGATLGIAATIALKLCGLSMAWGWPTMMCLILFVSGIQLLTIGILGQYLAKTYVETKRRPHYVVRERGGGASVPRGKISQSTDNR